MNKNGIQLIERKKLKNMMIEQGGSQSELVNNQSTAIEITKLLGAEYLNNKRIYYLSLE